MLILVMLPNKIFTVLHVEYRSLKNAFIYLFNLIRNTESPEMNSAIGYELMNTYSLIGNPYAEKFTLKPKGK